MKNQKISAQNARKRWPKWLKVVAWFFGILFALQVAATLGLRWYAARQPGGTEAFQAGVDVRSKMVSLKSLLELQKFLDGDYPSQESGLASLFSNSGSANSTTPEQIKEFLTDPWGHEFRYRHPGIHNEKSYDLYSLGPDGAEGTEDDVRNW